MTRDLFRPVLPDPFMLWADLALNTTEMLLASSQVIGTRVGRIAQAGVNPSARGWQQWLGGWGAMNALAPVHGAATANAKRLARTRKGG